MLINNSAAARPAYRNLPRNAAGATLSTDSTPKSNKALVTGGVAAGGLALGAGMIFKDELLALGSSFQESAKPVLDAVAPIFGGFAVGAVAGAITGGGYGAVATMDQHDSGPLFAVLGGGIGGMLLGGVAGGVSAAFGATPLLAIPAVIVGGAAFSYMNR